jgi:hypothetical protein
MKGALEIERFSLKRPIVEDLWEVLLYWGPWMEDMLRKALDTGIYLHRSPVGEPGGDLPARTFERNG